MAALIVRKYKLAFLDKLTLSMPKTARILSIRMHKGEPCLWAEVEAEAPDADRYFRTFETGQMILPAAGKRLKYLGTYQLPNEGDEGHVYEEVGF